VLHCIHCLGASVITLQWLSRVDAIGRWACATGENKLWLSFLQARRIDFPGAAGSVFPAATLAVVNHPDSQSSSYFRRRLQLLTLTLLCAQLPLHALALIDCCSMRCCSRIPVAPV
jgi:hypothetical protein